MYLTAHKTDQEGVNDLDTAMSSGYTPLGECNLNHNALTAMSWDMHCTWHVTKLGKHLSGMDEAGGWRVTLDDEELLGRLGRIKFQKGTDQGDSREEKG